VNSEGMSGCDHGVTVLDQIPTQGASGNGHSGPAAKSRGRGRPKLTPVAYCGSRDCRLPIHGLKHERQVQDAIFDFRRRVEAVLIERAGRIGVYQAKRLNTLCILMALAARAALRLAAVERQPEVDHARWCGYADRVAKFSQQADQVFESLGLGGGGEDWLSQLLGQDRQPALTGPGNAPNSASRDETPLSGSLANDGSNGG
jgi:hypothetical protein